VTNKLSKYQTFNLKSCDRFIRHHLLPLAGDHLHRFPHHLLSLRHHLTLHRRQVEDRLKRYVDLLTILLLHRIHSKYYAFIHLIRTFGLRLLYHR
jgi:hypothetical protein